MRVNNFSLQVSDGKERDSGHVELPHNAVYSLRLGNHDYKRDCDAIVSVDGKEVGSFRIRAGATMVLERPAHDDGKFTFFEANSQQAADAKGGSVALCNRGLIQVVFRPERRREREVKTCGGLSMMPVGPGEQLVKGFTTQSNFADPQQNYGAGITGLTGKSDQTFVNVPNLDYEPNAEVTISLRLVCKSGVRELTSAPRSNEVPAPV